MTSTNSPKSYGSAEIKKLPQSQVEITGSIPTEIWEKYRGEAIKEISKTVTIDGFRKGNVPENILIAKVGESVINEETAEMALSGAYFDILVDNKIDAIGKPRIDVTKLAAGNPLEFKAVTAVVPEVKLPDVKKIAEEELKKKDPKDLDVSDKDVEDSIMRLRKIHAERQHSKKHDEEDHSKMTPEEHEKMIMDELPEFNDEFVRSLGGEFKDIEDFKSKVRLMVGENKKDEAREKLRIRISDAILKDMEIELPEIMIDTELNRTQAQFASDVEKMGVKLEDYLKHAHKTIAEIREEWRPHAIKKARLQLVLNAIARQEKIKPEPKEIEAEVAHILDHYKEADKARAEIYAETVLTNEKVFQWLENR